MTQAETSAILQRYWAGDRSALAVDTVFTDVETGERHEGRDAVVAMLDGFYREAFDVTAEDVRHLVGEGSAVLEATLVGRHVGVLRRGGDEQAGPPAAVRHLPGER